MQKAIVLYFLVISSLFSCQESNAPEEQTDDDFVCDFPMPEPEKFPIAAIETRLGTMYFWLFDETPHHKAKFIELAELEHYDAFTFNRVVPNFVIQGGCPDLPEYFEGSPYLIDPEFVDTIGHVYGALGMGRDDNPKKQSNACQFYIVSHEEGVPRLDGDYMIFGEIISGFDVLESIEKETIDSTNTPVNPIPIKVSIERHTDKELKKLFDYAH